MTLKSSPRTSSAAHAQSFKMKKLAVLGLIGFNCVLYLIAIFMAFRDALNEGMWIFHYSSILVLIILIPTVLILLLQGYFVYRKYTTPLYGHIFMVVNCVSALACLWCAIKVHWWFIWIMVLFTVALAAGMVIYWLALKKVANKKGKDTSRTGATSSGTGDATSTGTSSPTGTGASTGTGPTTPCSPLTHTHKLPIPSTSASKSTTNSCKSISKTPSLPSKPSRQ